MCGRSFQKDTKVYLRITGLKIRKKAIVQLGMCLYRSLTHYDRLCGYGYAHKLNLTLTWKLNYF